MTKQEALEKCLKLWKWLEENPGQDKRDAYAALFPWNSYGEWDMCLCPACQYASDQIKDCEELRCHHCPIWDQSKHSDYYPCENAPGSPYRIWKNISRKEGAKAMVLLIEGVIETGERF